MHGEKLANSVCLCINGPATVIRLLDLDQNLNVPIIVCCVLFYTPFLIFGCSQFN